MTEEDFNNFFWDSTNNKALRGGSKNSEGQICDFTGATYDKSYGIATALGCDSLASGPRSLAAGDNSKSVGVGSVAIGTRGVAFGANSFVTNVDNKAIGTNASSFGALNKANGDNSFTLGKSNEANGLTSLAEGEANKVNGSHSHVGGYQTSITGNYSFGFGKSLNISGSNSASFGSGNVVKGDNCLVVGSNNDDSDKDNSVMLGRGNYSPSNDCLSIGRYNLPSQLSGTDTLFLIGNGSKDGTTRSNAFAVFADGRAYLKSAPTTDNGVVRLIDLDTVVANGFKLEDISYAISYYYQSESYGVSYSYYNFNVDMAGNIQHLEIKSGTTTGTLTFLQRPCTYSYGRNKLKGYCDILLTINVNTWKATFKVSNYSSCPYSHMIQGTSIKTGSSWSNTGFTTTINLEPSYTAQTFTKFGALSNNDNSLTFIK